jgi:S-layer homology domain
MLEANPNLTTKHVKDILQRSATPLPLNYRHEVGAGLLNSYGAVLESAFPTRKTGLFRTVLETKTVEFSSYAAQFFNQTASPGTVSTTNFTLPENTIQASVSIGWNMSPNDLALKVNDTNGQLQGTSNNLNLAGLTGRREKVNLNNPSSPNFQAVVSHTANVGTTQNYYGVIEVSRINYSHLNDLNSLSTDSRNTILETIRSFVMLPQGKVFRPNSTVSRAEFAATLVRGGTVLQYVANSQMYSDVKDAYTRNVVESVQSNPNGRLIYDATAGGTFRPDNLTTKLVAAVAFVKAAGYENLASNSLLSPNVLDYLQIPSEYRGYVAVAIQKGFIKLDGNYFSINRPLTRLELAQAINKINHL